MRRAAKSIHYACLLVVVFAVFLPAARTWAAQARKSSRRSSAPTVHRSAPAKSSLVQSDRNIGKAYYEQGKYDQALEAFQKVVASGQALASDHFNLGLALMQANKFDQALGELTTAKQMDSKLVAADYNLGILYKRELRYPDAEAALKRVVEADPDEPAAWFNLGTVYFAQRKLEDALAAHKHVLDMGFGRGQNFYVASLFHTFTILVRLKQQAEAQKILKVHEKLRDKVPNISLQNPALEGGKYGMVIVPPVEPPVVVELPGAEKVTFAEITSKLGIAQPADAPPLSAEGRTGIKAAEYSLDMARRQLVPLFGPSLALGDYDGDGRTDLYVVDPAGSNHLYHNNGDGTFSDVTEKAGVAGPGGTISALFMDYNNTSHPSLILAGAGGVTLYHNNGDGTFRDQTEKAGLKGEAGELATRALMFDADYDGALDLVVVTYTDLSAPPKKDSFAFPADFQGGKVHFYRNNGDGTFTDVTSSTGLASAKGRFRQAAFADFNNDGYSDLLLVRDDASPLLFFNQGEDKFTNVTARTGASFTGYVATDAQVADFNHDGNFDIALWGPLGYRVLLNEGEGRFRIAAHLPPLAAPQGLFAFRGTVTDLNGDSFADLLAADAAGKLHFLLNRAGTFKDVELRLPASKVEPYAALLPAWLGSPGKLSLVAMMRSGRLEAFEKEGPPARWLEVKLIGYKSNQQGVGSLVEIKAGSFYDKVIATGGPVKLYASDLAKLDVVRVTWPNAVIQNWINVATNKPLEVRESERLSTSCPFLYVWNGERFVFVTDVLGTAPLGELLPDGSRIKPNPEEYVRLPQFMRPKDGKYVFQITDELREVDYLDQARLVAVDHPLSEEVFANEVYSSAGAAPKLYSIRQKHFPIAAVDEHGHDVLPLIRERDGRYPDDFRQLRILGLAEPHSLTLDLGNLSDPAHVSLWLTGWVFWTDSNASRALMSNRQLEMISPYLQVRNGRGEWVTVVPDMGVPSATNRTMRVDLSGKFLSSDHHVRIVTNFCVYWDQIWFTTGVAPTPASVELPLMAADLHYRGFSTPVTDPTHRKPDYFEYTSLMNEAPWNPAVGRYTRYGTVEKLLNRADDRMVVMSTGDEVTLEFDARKLPPLRPGWQRDFFLRLSGWAKDGEPNTAYSKTVAPLPFRGMSNYPYRPGERGPLEPYYERYLDEYQTRPGYVLIPPLAPAGSR